MLKGISVVNIPVKNYKESISFYTEKIGLTLVSNDPSFDHYELGVSDLKGPTLCLCEDAKFSGADTGITFSTDNIQATYRELRKKGVKVREPYEAHGEWWSSFVDPSGNSYGIHQVSD